MNPSFQFDAGGIRDLQVLWQDSECVYCRGRRVESDGGRSAVLAVLPTGDRAPSPLFDRFVHEYKLRDELDVGWAAKPLALAREGDRTTLLLDDPGGEPLARLIEGPMEVERFLRLAIGIVTALGKAHQRGIVHKDIKPANVLVNCADGRTRLTGFGISSRLPRERQAPEPPEVIAGTLAYMAPEQTGRMNRSIDSRSDLYSLGVTFYQMLTGSLPFGAADPMELVHCHIARKPVAPAERLDSVPAVLSQIVVKLLAKTAEDRYQTAAGLASDLRRCLAEWERSGRVEPFALGDRDRPDRLMIPEKLYGREREVESLLAAFDRVVASGAPALVLVSGYSGIGKSSVVNELHKALVPSRGLFASGKFDQYKRDTPYSTLMQAFRSLVRSLLSKSDAELATWREALLEALGPNGLLISDLIPELKAIVGEQPPLSPIEPQQAQGRFQLVFRRFISVFARAEHPLTLFFDDLQWLDRSTLDLIEDLLTQGDVRHLLLIGAYRDNEVGAAHPLAQTLRGIARSSVEVTEIKLGPLSGMEVARLTSDALRCELADVTPLSELVHTKTAGNPFFVLQFLNALADTRLLAFDQQTQRWSWDVHRIRLRGYADNVADLTASKLVRLQPETQRALQELACLGNLADIATLAAILETSEDKVHAALWEAVQHELVERLPRAYRFVHDRVQEAAYSSIPEEGRAQAHLRIGRRLIARTPQEDHEEAVFEIVGQLNRGAELLTAQTEREQVAELNLIAGKRAKRATAYASALNYFVAGTGMVSASARDRQRDIAFQLELNRAECEFLIGALPDADARLMSLSQLAANTLEQATIASLRIDLHTTLGQSPRAVETAIEFLSGIGIELSSHPTDIEAQREYDRVRLRIGGRAVDELLDLPLMTDPTSLEILDVLTKLVPAALFTDANLYCIAACKAVDLSLTRGYGDGSCPQLEWLGLVAGTRFGDYKAGFLLGQVGYALVERRQLLRFKARTYMLFAAHVIPWARNVKTGREILRSAFDAAKKSGDITFAQYSLFNLTSISIASGDPLREIQEEAEQSLRFALNVPFRAVIDIMEAQLALIKTLRGLTSNFGHLDDGQFEERQTEERFSGISDSTPTAMCWYWIRKLQARFYAAEYDAALAALFKAQPLYWATTSMFESAEYHFYGALSRSVYCDSAPSEERRQILDDLMVHSQQLRVWADNCPENFENRAALVNAEIARLQGRTLDAMDLYEQAIQSARRNGFVHNEALACELAARFHESRGHGIISNAYMRKALSCYARWGADGKVRQLKMLYPGLREDEREPALTSTIRAPVDALDLATVIEVSQAVSGEVIVEKLIETLMRTAIEQAGAERGVLVVPSWSDPRIAAEAATENDGVVVRLRDEPVTAAALPESVLHHVVRAKESVILDDALHQSAFAPDPYIRERQVRSILCLPLVNQTKLIGVLYLENNLARGVFAPARTAVLKLLASQAAIALENAHLYRDLAEREAKIRRLVDSNIIGIFIGDFDGRILEANDAFLRVVGYEREDLAAGHMRWTDLTPPDWRERDALWLEEHKRTGLRRPIEKEYFRKDGSRVPILLGSATVEDGGSQVVAFVLDLTERRRGEHALRESEERFRTLMQFSFDVYWETDAQHRFVRQDFSERVVDGPLPGSELGKTRWELPYLDIDEETWRKHRETLDAHLPFRDLEYARPTPNGGKRYAAVSGLPLFDETGRFIGYRGVGRHITERKQIEEALRQREKELREIVETIPAMTVTFTPDGQDAFIGKRFSEYSGLSEEDARGSGWKVAIHPDDLDLYLRKWRASIISGDPVEFEARVRRSDGEYRWFLARAVAQRDDRGNILKWYEVLTDIEDRKRAEAEARESERRYRETQAQLAHANRVATIGQLTASIAHEVNQPIAATVNNARGALRWLSARRPNLDEARQALNRIVRDGSRAGEVVGRIRNLIKKAPPSSERVDINAAIREVVEFTRSEAMKHGVLVQTDLVEGLPPVQGDRVELQQVILNLMLNAFEAMSETSEGARELLIGAAKTESGDDVLVTVRDSGPGLAPATLEHLFTAFYTTKPNGLGLGLSICSSIIESHGGRLSASANAPRGAIFQFTLPAHP